MAKYLVTGDIHLNDNPRDAYRHEFMSKTLPALIKKHSVVRLILLGDMTDDKDRHGAWLVNKVMEHLNNLTKLCHITILKGNHDYLDEHNPFFEFTKYVYVNWINRPVTEQQFTFLPHTNNHQRDWKDIKFGKYVFCHNTFAGAKAEHGRVLTGIPTSVFRAGTVVISGDVHVPQRLGPIIYAGAPYHINFGDDYEPRVLLLDDKLTSIRMPGPKKRLIELDLTQYDTISWTAAEGDILKVRAHINTKQMAGWAHIKDGIRDYGEKNGCIVHSIHPIVEYTPINDDKHTSRRHRSDDELLRSYGKARGVDDKILQVGLRLMEQR
jgi:hypothetical protein